MTVYIYVSFSSILWNKWIPWVTLTGLHLILWVEFEYNGDITHGTQTHEYNGGIVLWVWVQPKFFFSQVHFFFGKLIWRLESVVGERKDDFKEDQTTGHHFHGVSSSSGVSIMSSTSGIQVVHPLKQQSCRSVWTRFGGGQVTRFHRRMPAVCQCRLWGWCTQRVWDDVVTVVVSYPVPLVFFCDCVSPDIWGQCGSSVLTGGTTFRS